MDMLEEYSLPLIALGLGILVFFKYREALKKPTSWFVVACLAMLVCCGGGVFNILHRTPLLGTSKDDRGEVTYQIVASGVLLLLTCE